MNDSNQKCDVDSTTTSKLSSSFDSDYSLDSASSQNHQQQHASISISSSDNNNSINNSDSIKDRPVIRKPLVLPKPKNKSVNSKENYDIAPPSTTNNNKSNSKSGLDEEDIPAGYDPIEYEYLINKQSEQDSANDFPLGLLSRSTKSASNGSLVSVFSVISLFSSL